MVPLAIPTVIISIFILLTGIIKKDKNLKKLGLYGIIIPITILTSMITYIALFVPYP